MLTIGCLIIGCGNRQRGDDGAGVLAAERLGRLGIEAKTCLGEASELMDAWSGADEVILIDAVATGAAAGTVHVWNAQLPMARGRSSSSTHGIGVAEAIALARTLDRLPARLRVYGIEGKTFEVGSDISAEVRNAIEEVVRRIVDEIAQSEESSTAR